MHKDFNSKQYSSLTLIFTGIIRKRFLGDLEYNMNSENIQSGPNQNIYTLFHITTFSLLTLAYTFPPNQFLSIKTWQFYTDISN